MNLRLPALVLLLSCAVVVAAQDDPLKPSSRYDSAVPTVESVLGYRVGEAFTPYADLERYYKTLAAASDRLRLEPYGKSVEGRTLYLIIVSTPENRSEERRVGKECRL